MSVIFVSDEVCLLSITPPDFLNLRMGFNLYHLQDSL